MLDRFSVNDDFRAFYCAHGYVVFSDLYDVAQLERARNAIAALFARRLDAEAPAGADARMMLADHYESNRERWRSAASRMWDLLPVYRLAADPRVETALCELGLAEPAISTRPEVRTDMPGDQQYRQPWHQDWRYGQGSANAVTIWTPLHDVGTSDGTIDLIPGSHLRGYLEAELLTDPRRFSISDPRLDDEEHAPAELKLGEAIVFSQFLVHRSGWNTSSTARITVQTRFSDFAEPRFAAAGFPAPVDDDLAWDVPPDAAELGRIFAAG
jgi:ectoine hydroxylase-related dioxygenase (phytanoyl-CoA dioxygenase family)